MSELRITLAGLLPALLVTPSWQDGAVLGVAATGLSVLARVIDAAWRTRLTPRLRPAPTLVAGSAWLASLNILSQAYAPGLAVGTGALLPLLIASAFLPRTEPASGGVLPLLIPLVLLPVFGLARGWLPPVTPALPALVLFLAAALLAVAGLRTRRPDA
jgi:hypothetical protein